MADRLTDLLVAPVSPVDASSWHAALADATAMLARLAVRRAGAGPFRVTDHEVRAVLHGDAADRVAPSPFAWSARTARRALGLAAVRLLVAGGARSPVEAVRARLDESARWVHEGNPCATQLDRWVAGLSPAGRAAVGADAVTWATRLWCAVDWAALGPAPASPSGATAGGTARTRRCSRCGAGPRSAPTAPTSSCCPVPAATRCGPSSPS